jgi:hypothetical protein
MCPQNATISMQGAVFSRFDVFGGIPSKSKNQQHEGLIPSERTM